MDGTIRYPVKVPRVSTMDHVSQRLCGGHGAAHHRNHKSYRREPQGTLVETQNGRARGIAGCHSVIFNRQSSICRHPHT